MFLRSTTDRFEFSTKDDADAIGDFGVEETDQQIALLLPAVQSAREAARRTTCSDVDDDGSAFAFAAEEPEAVTIDWVALTGW